MSQPWTSAADTGPIIHDFRRSAYARLECDFYPTPAVVTRGLVAGLQQVGVPLPKLALDPCGGDGAIRRALKPFGCDVRLTDLYPQFYCRDGYLAQIPLDARRVEDLRVALALASIRAMITNGPRGRDGPQIARAVVDLVVAGELDFAAMLFRPTWADEKGRMPLLRSGVFHAEINLCWRTVWFDPGPDEKASQPMHTSSWFIFSRAAGRHPLRISVLKEEAEVISPSQGRRRGQESNPSA
jgi:hypothetical protein